MGICAKIFTLAVCCILCSILNGSDKGFAVCNTNGSDIPFREIMFANSMADNNFSCTVEKDTFDSALKKLADGRTDMVLVKKTPAELTELAPEFAVIQYASTPIIVAVNSKNPLKKMSLDDFCKVWNNDYSTWNVFDSKNIFTIHRFGMRHDDSGFLYLLEHLKLRKDAQHFPLESSKQIITMTAANPHAISIFIYEKDLDFSKINMLQLTGNDGRNISLNMPHSVIFRAAERKKIENFLKAKKEK